jgi:UDP-2-acetamido-2,6-beta-L-arabino-hexul-4-ose reductase
MRILITGAFGFVGRNLSCHLAAGGHELIRLGRGTPDHELRDAVARCDRIVHLAGANRPEDPTEFMRTNADLTAHLCDVVKTVGAPRPIIFSSSIQAEQDNAYGRSKRAAEEALQGLQRKTGNPISIFRLPNVFGKWCRPNYNSAVATFCHNLARSLPISIHDPTRPLRLVYIDDVVQAFTQLLTCDGPLSPQCEVDPVYDITVGELAEQIRRFDRCRDDLVVERVGAGLVRALYATYVSYLPPERFTYPVASHSDARGTFVEMLRTHDSGQFSFFTAGPGVTRGGHYHHTKTEKFLVLRGRARFRFTHIDTGERHELTTSQEVPSVVETIPGWAHDITNLGDDELIVMLWANERFDRSRPDTYAKELS